MASSQSAPGAGHRKSSTWRRLRSNAPSRSRRRRASSSSRSMRRQTRYTVASLAADPGSDRYRSKCFECSREKRVLVALLNKLSTGSNPSCAAHLPAQIRGHCGRPGPRRLKRGFREASERWIRQLPGAHPRAERLHDYAKHALVSRVGSAGDHQPVQAGCMEAPVMRLAPLPPDVVYGPNHR